jgi:hypothetical protein
VQLQKELGRWLKTDKGMRQGNPISSTQFIVDLGRAMDRVKANCREVSVHGVKINNLRFTDDIDIVEEEVDELVRKVTRLSRESRLNRWS